MENVPRIGVNMVLSKVPLKNIVVKNMGKDPVMKICRYVMFFDVDIGTKTFHVAGTHLDVYDETEETHCRQIDMILNGFSHTDDLIIMGEVIITRKNGML